MHLESFDSDLWTVNGGQRRVRSGKVVGVALLVSRWQFEAILMIECGACGIVLD